MGYEVHLRVDANQGWTPQEAVSILHKMEDADIRIEFVEQPVKAHDLKGLKFVKDHVSIPVMADESAFSPGMFLKSLRWVPQISLTLN